jgi:hypothetical protein
VQVDGLAKVDSPAKVDGAALASRKVAGARRIIARSVGSLASRDFIGATVHSEFAQACNLEMSDRTLITLLDRSLGNAPHGIVCELPASFAFDSVVRAGFAALLHDGELTIERAGLVIDVSHASRWSGAVSQYPIDPSSPNVRRAIGHLSELLQRSPLSYGLFASWSSAAEAVSPLQAALARRLACCLPPLARGTVARAAVPIQAALSPMIGLGVGLTPSGDDFIVGYLAALWSQSARDATLPPLLGLLRAPIESMTAKTGEISRQFILDASEGQFSEPLVDLVRAIADGDDERVAVTAARALRIGHSSGADALLGLLLGYDPRALAARILIQPLSNEPVANQPVLKQQMANQSEPIALDA